MKEPHMFKPVLISLPFSFCLLFAAATLEPIPPTDTVGHVRTASTLFALGGAKLSDRTQEKLETAAHLLDETVVGQQIKDTVSSTLELALSKASIQVYKLRGYEEHIVITRTYTEGGWAYFISCGCCGRPEVPMETVEVQLYLPSSKSWSGKDDLIIHQSFTRRAKND